MSVTATKRARREAKQTDQHQRTRQKFAVDVGFVKAFDETQDGSGDLVLKGYASTWTLDRDNEIVARDAFDGSLADYLKNNPILLWQHDQNSPIGRVTKAQTDATGLYVECVVPNPGPDAADYQKAAYNAIRLGIVTTFSIGGFMTRDVEMGASGPVFSITEVELMEISAVSIPSNAPSIFEAAVKSFDGAPQRLSERARSQMEQLIGFEHVSDPELVLMSEEKRAKRYELLSELFREAHEGAEPPAMGAYLKVEKAAAAGVDERSIIKATFAVANAYLRPEVTEKAGRVLSQATKGKLQQAADLHDQASDHMADAIGSLQSVVDAHSEARAVLGDLIGEKPGEQDEDEHESEEPESPEDDDRKPQGTGNVVTSAGKAASIPDGMVKCPTCDGKGKIMAGKRECPDCSGKGYVGEDTDVAQGKSEPVDAKDGNAGNAQPMIDWYNAGADGQIDWGKPGDFDQCVAIAKEHLSDPEGFCQERHIDATGSPAGHASGESPKKAIEAAALQAKDLISNIQQQLQQQGRALLGHDGTPPMYQDEIYCYLDDVDPDEHVAYFCCFGSGAGDGMFAVPYTVDGSTYTLSGEAKPVVQEVSYVPKGLHFRFVGEGERDELKSTEAQTRYDELVKQFDAATSD